MAQTTGTFPALSDNYKRKPKVKVTPLPIQKYLPPPPAPKKKGR